MTMEEVNALFWYEPSLSGSNGQVTLQAADVARAFGAASASPLGRGAFGETWRLDGGGGTLAPQAAKVILNPDYPAQLLAREVGGLGRVTNAHVVNLTWSGDVILAVGRRAALVFEFVDGGDVASRLVTGILPAVHEVCGFAVGLLSAVAALHHVETVHRDIKPENIALRGGRWEDPVLLDLGLAKLLDAESLTTYPQLLGTLPFMAPEQIRGEPARKAADVWAVGVVLHVLLSGQHPFYDGRAGAVLRSDALDRLMGGPRGLPVMVPPNLAALVARFLSADAYQRGSAARGLRDVLTIAATAGDNDRGEG